MSWEKAQLVDVAEYRTEKIESDKLVIANYISTDNMIPMKGGVVETSYPPSSNKVSAFFTNDVLVSNIRPYFKKIWFADREGGCSNDVIVFKPFLKKIYPKFLYYQLSQDGFFDFMMSGASGTKMPRGNKNAIPQFNLLLPPLASQQKIASILSAYDDLIENNLKRIKLLEEAVQNIYKEWFVHFRFPGYESAKFGEDGLPEGWEKKKISDLCDISGGGTPPTKVSEYWDGGNIFWFSPTDLSKNSSIVLLNSAKKITEAGLSRSSAKLLPARTILMSSRATIGLFGIISQPCSTNQGFINMIPFEEWTRYYLLFNLKNRKEEIIGNASGATFKEISKRVFKEMEIVHPNDGLLKKWNILSESIINQIENLETQNQTLKEARDILLTRLMNRTIEV